MSPLRVEVNGHDYGTIPDVGSLDIPHPINPLAFGGRVSYYGDTIGYASIIGPEGDTVGAVLETNGASITMTVDLTRLSLMSPEPSYTISATRIE